MRATTFIPAALFASVVYGVAITSPASNETVDLTSSSFTVTWSTVESDPSTAHLFLVNMVSGHSQYSQDLGQVELSAGSYTVSPISGLASEDGYQFNLVSETTNDSGILAQSAQFTVEAAAISSSSSSSAVSTSSTASSSSTTSSGSSTTTSAVVSVTSITETLLSTMSSSTMTMVTTITSSSTLSSGSSGASSTSSSATAKSTNGAAHVAGGSLAAFAFWVAAVIA